MEKYLVVSVESQFKIQNQSEPRTVKWMSSKRILFQFFRDQAESEQGHEGGGVAKAGQKEEEKGWVALVLR